MPTSVFISSTFRDLAEHRATVQRSLLNAGLHPIGMESFGAIPVEPTRACLDELRTADLFVGIYAWRYGFVPEGSSVSITEQEFDEARRLGKPCFCFFVDEEWPWPDVFREKGVAADRLWALKARIDRELTRTTFTSPEHLATQVLASLQRWQRQHRAAAMHTEDEFHGRQILLERVRSFWIEGLLERIAAEMPLQDLPKDADTEAVAQLWRNVGEPPVATRCPLPASRSAYELFEDAGRALLLLGAPGSGKTVTLLELARDAAKQVDRDPAQPIPVVFNLSSWGRQKVRLIDWLTEELATKYQIPREMGRFWIKRDDLLLLLDSLDEVPQERRAACVEAINKFREEQGFTSLVVACRTGAYETLRIKLVLGTSVVLKPLEAAQVEAALPSDDANLLNLKKALAADPGLRELAESPLLLGIMRRAYSHKSTEELLDPEFADPVVRRHHLFTTYIDRMLSRRGGPLPYPRNHILGWLSWLARGMDRAHRSVFLLEELQPGWLDRRRELIVYSIFSLLIPGLLISAFLALLQLGSLAAVAVVMLILIGSIDGVAQSILMSRDVKPWRLRTARALLVFTVVTLTSLSFLPEALLYCVIAGIWGAASGFQSNSWDAWARIQPLEALGWSWRQALRRTFLAPFSPLGFFLAILCGWLVIIFGAADIVSELQGVSSSPSETLSGWIFLAPLLLLFLLSGFTGKARQDKSYPNQGIWLSGKHGLTFGFISALTILLVLMVSSKLPAAKVTAMAFLGGDTIAQTIDSIVYWHTGSSVFIFACVSLSSLTGLCIGLANGGSDFLMHFQLRLYFSIRRNLPFRAVPFLDFAADRILLHKVGGGYVFIHRLLLEHFASLEPDICDKITGE